MNVRLSPRHGVNPSIDQCFFCMKDVGVALLGHLKDDAQAPRCTCFNMDPCAECAEFMKRGIILISVANDSEDNTNPYRTGGWCVITEKAVKRIITTPDLLENVLAKRMAFVPDEAWVLVGLPGIKAVRDCECRGCGHTCVVDVERGPTTNISGEMTRWCPECVEKMDGAPVRYEVCDVPTED